jgi:hypothetical protein
MSQDGFMSLARQDGFSNFIQLPQGWTQATDKAGKVCGNVFLLFCVFKHVFFDLSCTYPLNLLKPTQTKYARQVYYFNQQLGLSQWDPPAFLKTAGGQNLEANVAPAQPTAQQSSPQVASASSGAQQQQPVAAAIQPSMDASGYNNQQVLSHQGQNMASMQQAGQQSDSASEGDDSNADSDQDMYDGYESDEDRYADEYADENAGADDYDDGQQNSQAYSQKRRQQTLAGEEVPPTEDIADVSDDASWPRDLPGAMGDDTSWVVGMHREPLWSDSQTGACGTTIPCEKGQADRGHDFQRNTNPWVDKRRTFDPYAQATEEGRANYPWDPTRDPQVGFVFGYMCACLFQYVYTYVCTYIVYIYIYT